MKRGPAEPEIELFGRIPAPAGWLLRPAGPDNSDLYRELIKPTVRLAITEAGLLRNPDWWSCDLRARGLLDWARWCQERVHKSLQDVTKSRRGDAYLGFGTASSVNARAPRHGNQRGGRSSDRKRSRGKRIPARLAPPRRHASLKHLSDGS